MNIKARLERNNQIMEYLKDHTFFETAVQFDLSVNQIFRIKKSMSGEEKKRMIGKKAWFRKVWPAEEAHNNNG